jgi:hypothetical protein
MPGVADVAVAVAGLIAVEVLEGLCATLRERAVVAVVRVEAVIYVTIKAVRTMEPGASSDKDAASEPVRTVITVGRAVVGSIVEVPVRAAGGWAEIHADGDLTGSGGRRRTSDCCGGNHRKD